MQMRQKFPLAALGLALLLTATAGAAMPPHAMEQPGHPMPQKAAAKPYSTAGTIAIDLSKINNLDGILHELLENRVVFVGETHDRYEHHLNQLAIIKAMHERHPEMAIGLEFFQWPYQGVLDRFVAGEIDEAQMLRETEYFSRWRFDYRLYKPILDFAREQKIPLIALNVPRELTEKVAQGGLASLTTEERAQLPAEMERDDPAYRDRIEAIYKMHPQRPGSNFDNFLDAQLLWDEGMAQRAADYLSQHPQTHMVILAGNGHVVEGTGIPARLQRRLAVSQAIVINGGEMGIKPQMGDYLLLPEAQELPPRGLLGLYLNPGDEGLVVDKIDDNSAGGEAGIKVGDRLQAINGQVLKDYADLRIVMLGMVASDKVQATVVRKGWLGKNSEKVFEVTLR